MVTISRKNRNWKKSIVNLGQRPGGGMLDISLGGEVQPGPLIPWPCKTKITHSDF